MLEGQVKKISLGAQTYEVSLSYELSNFSVSQEGSEITDASVLADLYAVNRALLFSEAILDVQRGDVLGSVQQAEIAVAHIDIVQQLEKTYETVISTAGLVSSLYGGFSGVSRWAEEVPAMATELVSWVSTMAFEDAEAATFHFLVDGALAAAKDVSYQAYQTYLKAEKTDEVLSSEEIVEMAYGAAQSVAISSDLSLLIASFDLESEGWGALFKDLALSVSGALIDTFKATDTARDLASLDPVWDAAIKTSGPLNSGLGLVDFTAGGVELVAQMQELLSASFSYYNSQDLSFLSSSAISEFEQGFSGLLTTPDDPSDDYVQENPFDDHGDAAPSATPVVLGNINEFTSISGTREVRGDDDAYQISLSAGQKIAILLWASNGLDPFVSVEFPNGTTLTNDDLSASSLTSFLTFMAPASGTYTITASGVGSTTGDYILNITPLETDEAAQDLTKENNPATDGGNTSGWHWQGTSDDDNPSTLTLEAGGAPDVDGDNRYRGHDGDDKIEAGRGGDVIWGDDDDDRLYGEDGDDTIRGGDDDDRIYGGDDDDLIYGEDGDDRIFGDTSSTRDNGDDTIYGGDGEDDISGGRGDDYIKGEDDNDEINGNDGDDEIYGDRGDDELDGDGGNDLLFGGRGNDDIEGDDGHDRLAGEDGNDTLEGGDGDDLLYGGDDDDLLEGGRGNDLLHGEDGNDTADFSDGNDGVIANLFDEIASSNDLGTDILYSIENLIGSDGDDVFDGDHGANRLTGEDGDDAIRGHNGNDILLGGDDDDVLWGDAGDDTVHGEDDDDELRGGLGNDSLNGGSGDDHLRGEQDNDTIDGGTGTDAVFFWGEFKDFEIVEVSPGVVRVTDLRPDGLEGVDTLTNVEFIEFFDRTVSVADLFAPAPVLTNDLAETTADLVISIDAAANDQSNASLAWISDASVSSGVGLVSVIGGQVIFDPNGQFQHLSSDDAETVTISYTLETSGGQSTQGNIGVVVSGTGPTATTFNDGDGTPPDPTIDWQWWDERFGVGDAYAGDEFVFGGAGDDDIVASMGDDVIDGGTGYNQVTVTGDVADFTWSIDAESGYLASAHETFGYDQYAPGIAFWFETGGWMSHEDVLGLVDTGPTATTFNDGDGTPPDPTIDWQWWDERFGVGDAYAGDEFVFGGAGDDDIVASTGDDVIDGGTGYNQVTVTGDVADFTWSIDAESGYLASAHETFGYDQYAPGIAFWFETGGWMSHEDVLGLVDTGPTATTFNDGDGTPPDPTIDWQWWDERFGVGDAYAGDEFVFGGAGDDDIVASTGDDVIDGGTGYNQVTVTGDVADFTWSIDAESGYLASAHETFGYDQYAPGIAFWFETGGWMSHEDVLGLV